MFSGVGIIPIQIYYSQNKFLFFNIHLSFTVIYHDILFIIFTV